MICQRCYFKMGVIETRCKVCGKKPSRLKMNIVAMSSLVAGLTLGWSLVVFLRV